MQSNVTPPKLKKARHYGFAQRLSTRADKITDPLTKNLDCNNDSENDFSFWSDEFSSGFPFRSIRDLETAYHVADKETEKASYAEQLMLSYLIGNCGSQTFAADKEKEVFWFSQALRHKSSRAYWLAACVAHAGEKITENFKPLREAMMKKGYSVSKEDAHNYAITAAFAGCGKAISLIESSMKNPANPKNAGILGELKKRGIPLNPDLIGDLTVKSAMAKDAGKCWFVYNVLNNKNFAKKDPYKRAIVEAAEKSGITRTGEQIYDFLARAIDAEIPQALSEASCLLYSDQQLEKKEKLEWALRRRGTIPSEKLRAQLRMKAFINGDVHCAWNIAQQLICYNKNPLKAHEKDQVMAEVLREEYQIESTMETAGELVLLAASDGFSNACWILAQAVRHRTKSTDGTYLLNTLKTHGIETDEALEDLYNEAIVVSALNSHGEAARVLGGEIKYALDQNNMDKGIIKKLKEFGVDKLDRNFVSELTMLAALCGSYKASSIYFNVLDEQVDMGSVSQKRVLKDLNIRDEKRLKGSLAQNITASSKDTYLLAGFYTNAELVEMSKKRLTKEELGQCRAQMLEKVRTHLPKERQCHQKLLINLS